MWMSLRTNPLPYGGNDIAFGQWWRRARLSRVAEAWSLLIKNDVHLDHRSKKKPDQQGFLLLGCVVDGGNQASRR